MRAIPFLLIGFLLPGSTILAALDERIAEDAKAASPLGFYWSASLTSEEVPDTIQGRRLYRGRMRSEALKKTNTAQPALNKTKTRRVALNKRAPQTLLPVFNQKDIENKHKNIANEAMLEMPVQCRSILKNFHVRYNNPKDRGLGGKSTIILSGNVPDDEFRALFIHEFGHMMDLGCFNGTKVSGPSPFKDGREIIYKDDPSFDFYSISWLNENVKRGGMTEEDFVSGYASWDPFEDMAESFAYYVLQREAFVERAQTNPIIAQKLAWFQKYIPGMEIASGKHTWTGNVPWDITKLPYAWNPEVEVIASH